MNDNYIICLNKKKKTKLALKKEKFQKFCTDEFNKCVERIKKRMQKEEFRVGTKYNFITTGFQKNSTPRQVFADDAYRSELEWSPYYIIGKLVHGYVEYEDNPLYGDIKFNIVHKDEILKMINEMNEKQEEDRKMRLAKCEKQEFEEYQRLKKKFEKKKG